MNAPPAQTARLRIEPLRVAHAERMFPLLADPRLYAYVPDHARTTLAELAQRFAQLERGAAPDDDEVWLNWVLLRLDDGEPVGSLQATVLPQGEAWIGYTLVTAAWGRGYATEAVRWLVDELARRHGVRVLHASVDVRNTRSIALLERLAFLRTGTEDAELHGEASRDHRYRLDCAA